MFTEGGCFPKEVFGSIFTDSLKGGVHQREVFAEEGYSLKGVFTEGDVHQREAGPPLAGGQGGHGPPPLF